MGLAFAAWVTAVAACTFPDVDIDPNAECERDDHCPGQGRCIDLRCVACTTDADCAEISPGSRCSAVGDCVACLSDADCDDSACDVASGRCLECETDADCDAQRCDAGICVECLEDGDCDGWCLDRRCVECAEDSHCDPPHCLDERCVQCIVESDCGPNETCDTALHLCKPDHCTDMEMGPNETGVDCGGVCPPCGVESGCNDATDCASGVCVDNVCQPCTSSASCPEDAYCDGNVCAPRLPIGASCASMQDACVTDGVCSHGVCCEAECSGTCQGCSENETGQPSGQCTQVVEGTMCVTLTLLSGTCNASGVCSVLGG